MANDYTIGQLTPSANSYDEPVVIDESPDEPEARRRPRRRNQAPEIVTGGAPGAIVLPEGMPPKAALDHLVRFVQNDSESLVRLTDDIEVFPWDGAYAMKLALLEMFGAIYQKPEEFMGAKRAPTEITLQTDAHGGTVTVPWGRVEFPGGDSEEWLGNELVMTRSGPGLRVMGEVRRKHKDLFERFAKLVRRKIAEHSLYKGKAVRIDFDEAMPTPGFLDLTKTAPEDLVFRREVMRAIETNVWTPLRHREACAAAGIPFKRGILLAGPYGTGKTLVAHATARVAAEHGVTFAYLKDVTDIAQAIRFAQRYAPAVVFAEDVDRTTDGERDVALDDVLNTIDGVDTKGADVMVVFTTNHAEKINPAMRRPGRLDAVLAIEPPDAAAAEVLLRRYGRGLIAEQVDLGGVAAQLAGKIPAVIREVVERSKLEMLRRTAGTGGPILAVDLTEAAEEVRLQQDAFAAAEEVPAAPTLDTVARQLLTSVLEGIVEPMFDQKIATVRAQISELGQPLGRHDRRVKEMHEGIMLLVKRGA